MRRVALAATVLTLLMSGSFIAKLADPGEIHFVLLRDAIPAITDPRFSGGSIDGRISVVGVVIDGDARAYPIPILSFHEIVNDVVGGIPVAVTYWPLCGTGIVFDRRVGEYVLTFRVSGRLLQNNLVMYDVETNSQWSQLLGEALTGPLEETRLGLITSAMTSFEHWKSLHPDTKVLAEPPGARSLSGDPYAPYYVSDETLFPVRVPDPRMHPKAFVLGIVLNGDSIAFPYEVLRSEPVVNATVGEVPVVVTYQLDFAAAWERGDRSFSRGTGLAMLDETGREWNMATGEAADGAERLQPVRAVPSFWFAWKDFYPETRVYGSPTPYHGTFNSGFVLSPSFLFLLFVLLVAALAGRDLYRHLRNRGPWADPAWRFSLSQAYWASLGVLTAWLVIGDALVPLRLAYRILGLSLAGGILGLVALHSWRLLGSLGCDQRQTRLGGEETRRRLRAALVREGRPYEERMVPRRLAFAPALHSFSLTDGAALCTDRGGTILVSRKGLSRVRRDSLRRLVEAAVESPLVEVRPAPQTPMDAST